MLMSFLSNRMCQGIFSYRNLGPVKIFFQKICIKRNIPLNSLLVSDYFKLFGLFDFVVFSSKITLTMFYFTLTKVFCYRELITENNLKKMHF